MNRLRGFTLIELLVVVTIISILSCILLPSIKMVRDSSISTKCRSGTTQYFLGMEAYAADWDGYYAAAVPLIGQQWTETLHPYIQAHGGGGPDNGGQASQSNMYYCPLRIAEVRATGGQLDWWLGYGYNICPIPGEWGNSAGWGGPTELRYYHQGEVQRKSERIMIGDWVQRCLAVWWATQAAEERSTRHRNRGNYVYFDGHTEAVDSAGVFAGYLPP